MTEILNKKSKERRYRIEPNIAEIDPVIEPLTDLDDDEDAIDRLLINTGFDTEEDMTAHSLAEADEFPVHQDRVPPEALGEDQALAKLQTSADDYIEPVDIGSPLVDIEQEPVHSQASYADPFTGHNDPVDIAGDSDFSAPHRLTLEFPTSLNSAFPTNTDDTPEALDLTALSSAFPEAGQKEAPSVYRNTSEELQDPFVQEQKPASIPSNLSGGEAAVKDYATPPAEEFTIDPADNNEEGALIPEEGIALNAPSPLQERNRLISVQEDMRQRIALLETKAQKTGRLSYAATLLSFVALCAALYIGYQNINTRAELSKLKDMQSIMQEDLNGLNEKLDNEKQAAEDSIETPSHFSNSSPVTPEGKPVALQAPFPRETKPSQTAAASEPGAVTKDSLAPSARKNQDLQVKSARNAALPAPFKIYTEKPAPENTGGKWSVNLAAFRQIEEARKKATEFKQKGIAVKVTKVNIKQATWYRLSVPGFRTKEAASTHSARLKKLLRLNSIWVAAI